MKIPKTFIELAIFVTVMAVGYMIVETNECYGSKTSKKPSVKKEDESVVMKKTDACAKPQQRNDSKPPHGDRGKKHTSGPSKGSSKGPSIVHTPGGGTPMLRRPKGGNSSKPKGK